MIIIFFHKEKQMNNKTLLLSIPLMEIKRPAPAIYHLKGQLIQSGVECKAIDTNIIVYNQMKDKWTDVEPLLAWHNHNPDKELYTELRTRLELIVHHEIEEYLPDFVGLSIFSLNSRKIGEDIMIYIRKTFPNVKIIIGGTGLGESLGDTKFAYAEEMKARNLCDHFITGEAEITLVELVANNKTNMKGIDSPMQQIKSLEELAYANYDDCDHSLYPFADYDSGHPTYVLTGSRGCVRRCDFCDVYRLWPKFKTRSGKDIATEMIYHYERRGVFNFYFSDSLVNGSMKAFRELVDTLLVYKEESGMKFRWGGQFICRTSAQMSPEDYQNASAAGLENVGIGLEHASERIRKLMRKGFDNDALHDTIVNMSDNNIHTVMNMMSGHPLETPEDHMENIKFLQTYKWASDNGTIASMNLQHYIAFLEGTDFYDKKEEMVDTDVGPFWKNDLLDFPEIYNRRKEMGAKCELYGWNTINEHAFMEYMHRELEYYNNLKSNPDINRIELHEV
jgi:hypothetical protein|tara:strand:- start:385 stop:1902 length:1518 start_codon:yes stop_codon:yes gene_type:complete